MVELLPGSEAWTAELEGEDLVLDFVERDPGPLAKAVGKLVARLEAAEEQLAAQDVCRCCSVSLQPDPRPALCEDCVDSFTDYGVDGAHCHRHDPADTMAEDGS